MRFLIDGAGFINALGLAYSTEGQPENLDGSSSYDHLDGNWWRWVSDF